MKTLRRMLTTSKNSEKLDPFETSTQFIFACQQIEIAYQNARGTLKKKIKNEVRLSNYKCTSTGKKFGSCSSKYNLFYFPAPTFFNSNLPIINFQIIFQPFKPIYSHTSFYSLL